jgi:hypothetical protein
VAAACLAGLLFAVIVATAHATLEPVLDPVKQNQDVGPASCQATGNAACADTEVTPVPKDATPFGWSQFAGAEFPAAGNGTMDRGATLKVKQDADGNPIVPADVDFFSLAIKDATDAYAGGSQCKDPIPADKTKAGEITDYIRSCERVPVIYHYTQPDPDHLGAWSLEYKGDSQGYVGGLAYTADGLIVAAGGTGLSKGDANDFGAQIYTPENGPGAYPYREDCDPAKSTPVATPLTRDCTAELNAREAGSARVWMTHEGSPDWCEGFTPGGCDGKLSGDPPQIDNGASANPRYTPMGGLTALDCSPRASDEFACVAGGYQQLWTWKAGADGFEHGIDAQTAVSEISVPTSFSYPQQPPGAVASPLRFRVRSVRVSPGSSLAFNFGGAPTGSRQVFAGTAGCCDPTAATDQPGLLGYTHAGGWAVQQPGFADSRAASSQRQSYYDVFVEGVTPGSGDYSAFPVAAPDGPAPGPDDQPDPPSQPPGVRSDSPFGGGSSSGWGTYRAPATGLLSTARIVSAISDQSSDCTGSTNPGCREQPDGVPDWGVGELARTGQGLLWSSLNSGGTPTPVHCPPTPDTTCKPYTAEELTATEAAKSLMRASSFSLNTFSTTYTGLDRTVDTGVGWAVGDRGGIMRLGSGASSEHSGGKSQPPQLGRREQTPAADASAYNAFRNPPIASPAAVPPLAARPVEHLATPRLVPAGIPDATRTATCSCGQDTAKHDLPSEVPNSIVMSRDGSEGWALGSFDFFDDAYPHIALFHYLGGEWRRCDPAGAPTHGHGSPTLAADPACSSLADLTAPNSLADPLPKAPPDGHSPYPTIVSAARIPTENDADPSNDDDFQVVAVGRAPYGDQAHGQHNAPLLFRYVGGRWSLDRPGTDQLARLIPNVTDQPMDLAFTSPHDGWLTVQSTGAWSRTFGQGGVPGLQFRIFHYDGSTWLDCGDATNTVACGDTSGELRSLTQSSSPPQGAGPFHLAVAGSRIFLGGSRLIDESGASAVGVGDQSEAPLILSRAIGGQWSDQSDGLDPGWEAQQRGASVAPADHGFVTDISLAPDAQGKLAGWVMGEFGPPLGRGLTEGTAASSGTSNLSSTLLPPRPGRDETAATLLRLGVDGAWRPWRVRDAGEDYLFGTDLGIRSWPNRVVALPGGAASPGALAAPYIGEDTQLPPLAFDQRRGRWNALPTPFAYGGGGTSVDAAHQYYTEGAITAVAPDNAGGAWISAVGAHQDGGFNVLGWAPVQFYHYTDHVNKPVFDDIAHPIREHIVAGSGGGDGSFWVATETNRVYRYDRITGWEAMHVKGWDAGRLVTKRSLATAVAVNSEGSGVLVGEGGRIADLSPGGVRLDNAAGTVCEAVSLPAQPPCGTAQTLRAAAVASDGGALVGGDRRSLLWRPPTGDFRAIPPPPVASDTTFTAVSLISGGRAWVASEDGRIFAGEISGDGEVSWRTEEDGQAPDPSAQSSSGTPIETGLKVLAFSLDDSGHGYAVGTKGLVFERTGESGQAWRRLNTGFTDNYTSVAMGPGGKGVLLGGEFGRILTLVDGRFEVAREGDRWGPYSFYNLGENTMRVDAPFSAVVGVALEPGSKPGELEAWAASSVGHEQLRQAGTNQILHYSSDPSDRLLDPLAQPKPLADAPPPRPGELPFAVLGKSDCHFELPVCSPPAGSNLTNDRILGGIVSQLVAEASRAGGPRFALSTGDTSSVAGDGGLYDPARQAQDSFLATPAFDRDFVHARWAEQVADPLIDAGLPIFSALGAQDFDNNDEGVDLCSKLSPQFCAAKNGAAAGRTAFGWRQAFSEAPAPWGTAPPASANRLSFCPAADGLGNVSGAGIAVTDGAGTDGAGNVALANPESGGTATVATGGARTHYALDIRQGGCSGTALARVVVIDTAHGSLAGSASEDQPHEATTQLNWLKSVLCLQGDKASAGQDCTREPHEQAIVVSEDPPYSYGPGTTDTEQDATALESLLRQYRANVLISGKLGWNGLDWALAPGIHSPCPGQTYPNPSDVPELTRSGPCGADAGAGPANDALSKAEETAAGVGEGGGPGGGERCVGDGPNPTGTLPEVISASAGGKFAVDAPAQNLNAVGDPRADQGYWHGYTIVRLDKSGDPRCTIVETRPILEWIGIDGGQRPTHVLRPGQTLGLRGYGREPGGIEVQAQYDAINSFAITHRYDLLYADPERPWVAKADPNDPACDLPHNYCPITDSRVGTINPVTGEVKAGDGSQPRTFAIVELSVGQEAATYPLAFEPRPSFRQPPAPPTIQLPPASAPPPATAPPAPAPPFQPPTMATPPVLAPPPAQPPLAPPAPPAPPTGGPAQLDLFTSPPVLSVSPTVSLFPPSAPVINVAPPTPARPVEKAKKVAVQSSGSDSDAKQTGQEAQGQVDLVQKPMDAPGTSASTRHENNFTALAHRDQASAWARDLQWGGGLTLAALVLMFGWVTVRPTPRRRMPEVPAPAWNRRRR